MMQSTVTCVSAMFIRQMHFEEVGDFVEQHKHTYDHQTLLGHGSIRAEVEGRVVDFKAPQVIFVRAGKAHKFTALEPNTVAYCIHPLRDGENVTDIIDPAGDPFASAQVPDGTTSLIET